VRVLLSHSDDQPFELKRFGTAWRCAGGVPGELLPVTPSTAAALPASDGEVAGVLLAGGPDVEPWRFAAAPEPGIELHADPARDALDLALLRRAERAGWPVFAVCYGVQLLNVHHGGTLIQDLERAGRPGHRIRKPKDFVAHRVRRVAASRWLPDLPAELGVNSRHHQAIDRVADALAVIAIAPDGVVEAVERPDAGRFVVGVQWHPENMAQAEHVAQFAAFRAACLAHAAAAAVDTGTAAREG
jgi:gamma-glutamyl-gamma-aminobutyrate hydrolase PuuD